MLLSQKLKIFATVAFAGLVLMTASFVSPGWVNFNVNFPRPQFLSAFQYHTDGFVTSVHMTAGVWFYTICISEMNYRIRSDGFFHEKPIHDKKCHFGANSYDFQARILKEVNSNLLPEIKIISSTGIFCAVLGFIGIILYTKSEAKSRCAVSLACTSLLISSGTFIAAIVMTAKATPYCQKVFYPETFNDDIQFYCPWSLILGGVGVLFILVAGVGDLCILSRNRINIDINNYQTQKGKRQGKISQCSYTIITPPGYHEVIGLKEPIVDRKECVNR